MQNNKYFGSYYPVESSIHKLNPISKLICLILLLMPVIFSSSLQLEVVILFFIFMLIYMSKVPLKFYFDIIYGLRYILIVLVVLLASKGLNLDEAVTILFKIFNVILYLSLIFYTTTQSEMKYSLEKVLTPFNIFNLRISVFINIVVNVIRFIPLLLITERKVLISSSARGLDYFHTDILSRFITIVISFKNTLRLTNEKISNMKFNSKLRMYSTKKYRTNVKVNKFGILDIVIILVFMLFIYYIIRGVL